MIRATAIAWTDSLSRWGLSIEDRPRILDGFRALMDTCEAWPAPTQLRKAMPERERPVFRALPKPELTLADHQRSRAVVNLQRQQLGMEPLPDYEPPKPVPEAEEPTAEQREAMTARAKRAVQALRDRLDAEEGVRHGAP